MTRRIRPMATMVVLAAMMAFVATSDSAGSGAPTQSPSWPYPNGDLANTRVASDSTISSKNVASLKVAWSFKLTGKATKSISHYGSLALTPIVVDNVVYIQDLRCNVYALSLSSGALLWKYTVNKPELSGPGPNG